MTLGFFEINCPNCHKKYLLMEAISGNTIGAKFFSDGFMFAPMLKHSPLLRKCKNCKNYFWLNDTKVEHNFIGNLINAFEDDNVTNTESIEELSFFDYVNYLETETTTVNNELYVRKQIRYLFNHNNQINKDPIAYKIALNNLIKLMEIYESDLNYKDDDFFILELAEIYRNLKYFDKAITLLEQLYYKNTVDKKLKPTIEKLLNLAKNKEFEVVEI